MRVRKDLLKFITAQDVLEVGLAEQHRYSEEPVFSKRGTGHLSPTSAEDIERMDEQDMELRRKLIERLKASEEQRGSI